MNVARIAALARRIAEQRSRRHHQPLLLVRSAVDRAWPPIGSARAARTSSSPAAAESMSMIPMTGNKLAPNPWMVDNLPETLHGHGITAESLREQYGVTREDRRTSSRCRSHQKAIKAQAGRQIRRRDRAGGSEITSVDGRQSRSTPSTWCSRRTKGRAPTRRSKRSQS